MECRAKDVFGAYQASYQASCLTLSVPGLGLPGPVTERVKQHPGTRSTRRRARRESQPSVVAGRGLRRPRPSRVSISACQACSVHRSPALAQVGGGCRLDVCRYLIVIPLSGLTRVRTRRPPR